jgi:hypothetical protein
MSFSPCWLRLSKPTSKPEFLQAAVSRTLSHQDTYLADDRVALKAVYFSIQSVMRTMDSTDSALGIDSQSISHYL